MSGVERSGVEWSGVEWSGVEGSGVEWRGVEWSGVEWSGVEWSGVEWSVERWGEGRAGEKINFLIYVCRCHGNYLINWEFDQTAETCLVAMTTNYILSSDWSGGLVHNMNNICILGSIVSRPKFLQTFYYKSHKIQVSPETSTLNKSWIAHKQQPLKSTGWTNNNLFGQCCKNSTRQWFEDIYRALKIQDSTM